MRVASVALSVALPTTLLLTFTGLEVVAQQPLLIDRVEHHDVDNHCVNIHYVTLGDVGSDETLLFVHGFPNFWYVWHNQMEAFADEYRVVAMDTRATNRSGNRITFIFTDATGELSLYYDIELNTPLETEQTGGSMFPTTTIVTKNRVYVPVPKDLEPTFQITDGAKEFYVRFDTIP